MRLVSKRTVARRLDVTIRTLNRWIESNEMPAPTVILPGDNPRWIADVIDEWAVRRIAMKSESPEVGVKKKTGQ